MQKHKYKEEYPLWRVTKGYHLRTNQILCDGEVVQAYPDNDGRLWYYHPRTRKVVYVE